MSKSYEDFSDKEFDAIIEKASALGYSMGGRSFDDQYYWGGRVTRKGEAEHAAQAAIKGYEEGDPSFYDSFPTPEPLSGEWADGMSPSDLYWKLGLGEDFTDTDDMAVALAFEQGYGDGYHHEVIRSAKSFLGSNDNPRRTRNLAAEPHIYLGSPTRSKCDCERDACDTGHPLGGCDLPAAHRFEFYGEKQNLCRQCVEDSWFTHSLAPGVKPAWLRKNPRGVYDRFKPGDRVRVSVGSGLDSDRVGTIIPWSQYVGPAPRPDVRKASEAVWYDDASPAAEPEGNQTGYMFRSRLIKGDFQTTFKYHGLKKGWWKNPLTPKESKEVLESARESGAWGARRSNASINKAWQYGTMRGKAEVAYLHSKKPSDQKRGRDTANRAILAMQGLSQRERKNPHEDIPSWWEKGMRTPCSICRHRFSSHQILQGPGKPMVGGPCRERHCACEGYVQGPYKENPFQSFDAPGIPSKKFNECVSGKHGKCKGYMRYGKHQSWCACRCHWQGPRKNMENPPRTLLGRKTTEVCMTAGQAQGSFGSAYGLPDGSAFIKGVFTKLPGGRVKHICYLDEAKASRENLSPASRPWKHDFSTLDVICLRVKGGVLLKSKKGTPLWKNQ